MKNKFKYPNIIIALAISLAIALVFLLIGSKKQLLGLDEIYTYSLANSDAFEIIKESKEAYTGDEIIQKYMTVAPGNEFNFAQVFESQAKDVHPPLYYLFIHFFSSFVPGTYTRLIALGANIIFAVIVYWQMAWLFKQFCGKNKLSMIFSGLYLFTMFFTNIVMFFRMYVLLTVMTNFLIILFVKYKPWCDRTKWFYIGLFLTVLGGMQTQYYFSIIAAFVCAVYAGYLLYYKKVKDLILFVSAGLAAVGSSILIFPATLKHIFGGYRGKEAFEAFASSSLKNNIVSFVKIFNNQLFGSVFIIIFAVLMLMWFVSHKDKPYNLKLSYVLALITLPSVLYVCMIAKVAPYLTDRYVANVSGLLYLSVFGTMLLISEKLGKKGILLSILLAVIALVGSYKDGIPYLYEGDKEQYQIIKENHDIPCVYIFDTSEYRCVPYYMELSLYDSVMLMAEWHSDYVEYWQYLNNDELIVYFDNTEDDTEVLDIIVEHSPNIDGYSKLFNSGGVWVYLMD